MIKENSDDGILEKNGINNGNIPSKVPAENPKDQEQIMELMQ